VDVRARWLTNLFWTLRGRYAGDKPVPHEAILSYISMKGYDPRELYDWFVVADTAFAEWISEKREIEQKNLERQQKNAQHSIRH